MNSKQIKSLLAQPSVASVRLLDSEGGQLMPLKEADLIWLDNEFIRELDHTSERIILRDKWPEIDEGDIVMTPQGEGVVFNIFTFNLKIYGFQVQVGDKVNDYARHEIALISKAIK